MGNLKNKRLFITGGANGIGKGIVEAFCKEGARVCFCDTDVIAGKKLADEMHLYKCTFLETDISNADKLTENLQTLLKEWDDLDIIINNGGVSRFKPIEELSIDEFDEILKINLRSVFITAKVLAQHRAKLSITNSYGRIINIASTRYLMSEPNSEGYAASKGGIVSLTHALMMSLAKYHITVNCISPGWIDTGHYPISNTDESQHPSGRVGKPSDIASASLFLCAPENDFINGQNIVIDGGMTKKMIYAE